jgi:hypothetical protein
MKIRKKAVFRRGYRDEVDVCGNGQLPDKSKERQIPGASKSLMRLVAGGGFEPPTFGL